MAFPVATFLAILSCLQVQLSVAGERKCGSKIFQVHTDKVIPIRLTYGKNVEQHCRWYFVSHPRYVSRLECSAINLPPSPGCSMDQLKILSTDWKVKKQVYCNRGNTSLVVMGPGIDVVLNTSSQTPGGNLDCKVTAMMTNCSCGYKYQQQLPTVGASCACAQLMRRIYGGVETGVNEFPMMVLMLVGSERCGGTIISKRFVLTAAHCVDGMNITQIRVYAGEHDVSKKDESPATQRFAIEQAIVHDKYLTSDDVGYDIALLRLDRDIQFSERVGPACLPFKYTEHDFTRSVFTVVGWGQTRTEKYPDKLRKVDVNATSFEFCKRAYPYSRIVTENIGNYSKQKDSCKGDSGGPLLYTEPGTGRQFLIAVVSRGNGCAVEGYPGINVNVIPKLQWIVTNTPGVQYCAK